MGTKLRWFFFQMLLLSGTLLCSMPMLAQEEEQDSIKTGVSLGRLNLKNPNSIVSKYTYDPLIDRYIYTETLGQYNINKAFCLTST